MQESRIAHANGCPLICLFGPAEARGPAPEDSPEDRHPEDRRLTPETVRRNLASMSSDEKQSISMNNNSIGAVGLAACLILICGGCKPEPGPAGTKPVAAPEKSGRNAAATDDASLAKRLVGMWHEERPLPNGVSAAEDTTVLADGTFKSEAKITKAGKTQSYQATGQWEVKGGYLNQTITSLPQAPDKVGTKIAEKIVSVSETEFVFVNEKGETKTAKRKGR